MAGEEVPMTTAMLKAMANPLRREILRALARREYARAADLAEDMQVPANKLSFHLRVLADAGLIIEAPERARDRRDRVWTAADQTMSIGNPDHPVSDEALGSAVLASLIEDHQDLLRRFTAWAPEYVSGRSGAIHGTFTNATVFLTESEFTATLDAIQQVLQSAGKTSGKDNPERRMWQIAVLAADNEI